MGVNLTHQSKTDDYELETFSEISSLLDYFAPTPKEIIYKIGSMLDSLNCRQLASASRSLRRLFAPIIVYLSSQKMPDSDLARLCNVACKGFTSPKVIPQFLVLKSDKLVKYQIDGHPMHGLFVNCSGSGPLLEIPKLPFIVINWPNYRFYQNPITCSIDYIKRVFISQNYPNVTRLVLTNFVYSSELIELLNTKFDGLEYLNIASFNSKSDFDQNQNILSKFTTISELEVTLPTLSHFSFCPSIQLKKFTINILQPNYETDMGVIQTIDVSKCTLMKTLIIKKHYRSNLNLLYVYSLISGLEILISNTDGVYLSSSDLTTNWYSNLRIIYVGRYDKFPFLVRSSDGELSLNYDMVPKCEKFGVFDEFGKLHIIWKKQL